jgi:catechol 2,3-dioxygenase-like lactoylglutathione lyase family enzyme
MLAQPVNGRDGKPVFWISDASAGAGMGPNREVHLAFAATDHDAVRAFHDAAVELGAESLHAPRLWPEYHPGYFGAFVRDPDGNNVEAVCHA